MEFTPTHFRPSRRDVAGLLLLLCFFLVRGLNLAAVQLPFNGWDEFAHMAVAVHVKQFGEMPKPDDPVAEELQPFVQAHAHPWLSYVQVKAWNATLYPGGVCDSDLELPDSDSLLRLYQAQHGGLYYHLQALLIGDLDPASMLRWADQARILAVLLGAGVLTLWWLTICRLLPSAHGRWLAQGAMLLCAGYGYFAHNFSRVANDPLSIFLSSLAFFGYVWLLKDAPPSRKRLLWAFVLGGVCGLAVLAKATALPLVAVLGLGCLTPMLPVTRKRQPATHCLAAAALLTVGYLLVAGWYHWNCLQTYGSPTMMQEAVLNAKNGKTTLDILAALPDMPLNSMANFPFYYFQSYLGGWSGFAAPIWLDRVFMAAIVASGVCLLLCLARKGARRAAASMAPRLWEVTLLLCMTWAALLYHSLHSFVAWGVPTTGAWYGMMAMPCLFLLVLLGPRLTHRMAGGMVAAATLVVFGVGLYLGAYYVLPRCETGMVNVYNALFEVSRHHALLRYDLQLAIPVELLLYTSCLMWIGWSMAAPDSRCGEAAPASAQEK